MPKWKTVKDKNVRMVWACRGDDPDCKAAGKEITVPPTFYQESGEPLCGDCGQDMIYIRTEVCQ